MKTIKRQNLCIDSKYIAFEKLPLPYVHYPNNAGAFLGFSEKENSKIFFCSCYRDTLKNYIELRKKQLTQYPSYYTKPEKNCFFSCLDFPEDFVTELLKHNEHEYHEFFCFRDNLCHICNQMQPSIQTNFAGFSTFASRFYWYISKAKIDCGFYNGVSIELDNNVELLKLSKKVHYAASRAQHCRDTHSHYDLERMYNSVTSKLGRQLLNHFENHVRAKVGYKLIGEQWENETFLFYSICRLFPNYTVIHHYRPSFLRGMEFDIFIKEKHLALEYQGIQHFMPQSHWGGELSLQKIQERDKSKKTLANLHNIKIIYFSYKDRLDDKSIFEVLKRNEVDLP